MSAIVPTLISVPISLRIYSQNNDQSVKSTFRYKFFENTKELVFHGTTFL